MALDVRLNSRAMRNAVVLRSFPHGIVAFTRNFVCRPATIAMFAVCMLTAPEAFSQALPQIAPGGVVNAASYSEPISADSIISIFGTNLASMQATAQGTPLPLSLAGTSVTINGTTAPLLFVSPTQINLQAPKSTSPDSIESFGQSSVVVTTSAGSSPPLLAASADVSPSLFSLDGSGCGPAAVLNVSPDGSESVNSPSNSAAPGDYISLYGTGFGPTYFAPADGSAAGGLSRLESGAGVTIAGNIVGGILPYEGLAPTLVGVDQINLQIPTGTTEGCAVPISVTTYGNSFGLASPTMTLSIHTGRGQCVDPPARSYGVVTFAKTVTSSAAGVTSSDRVAASFPSGPNATIPVPPSPSLPNSYTANNPVMPATQRSCAVQGYSLASAGALTLTETSNGQTFVAQPTAVTGGAQYQQSLPNGFISPGTYTVSASGGPVQFQGSLSVPAPIQIQTPLAPGTQISVSHPFVINWTGGAPGELVKISLIGNKGLSTNTSFAYVDASAGSFTFTPVCTPFDPSSLMPPLCSFGPAMSYESVYDNHSVEIDVIPSSGYAAAISAQGTTDGVQLSWMYTYVFSGVSPAP